MKTITLARKPVVGTVAKNVLTHGCGGINIDASRIKTTESTIRTQKAQDNGGSMRDGTWKGGVTGSENGRFPANLILQHFDGCQQDGVKKVKGNRTDTRPDGDGGRADKSQWRFRPTDQTKRGFSDEDGKETVANWICELGCPVARLDEQSGERPSGGSATTKVRTGSLYEDGLSQRIITPYGDTGGASRFFKQVKK